MRSASRAWVYALVAWLGLSCSHGPASPSSICRDVCTDAEFCDPVDERCLPSNGACTARSECPKFRYPADLVDVRCDDGFCRVSRTGFTPAWVSSLTSNALSIDSPKAGDQVDADDLTFSWQEANASVLVFVLSAIPSSVAEFSSAVRWAASVPRGGSRSIHWSQGSDVAKGEWGAGTPKPPTPGKYYLLVTAVDLNRVIRSSELTPFSVGPFGSWPNVGDPCSVVGIPGGCDHPDDAQACHEGTCVALCGSNRDCEPGTYCGDPVPPEGPSPLRFCQDGARPKPGPAWSCDSQLFAADDCCDWGCGEADPDCQADERDGRYSKRSPEQCEICHCAEQEACAGARCIPQAWTCRADDYDDGSCDCGCGAFDVDCMGTEVRTCPPEGGGTGGGGGMEDGGTGGGGGPVCPGCTSGFCLEDETCVECLPSNDQCPWGNYCSNTNECTSGCKASGSGCASGECDETHNCVSCIHDAECMAALVCSDRKCSASCTAEQEGTSTGCHGELTCCSRHCAALATDSQNCGSCGRSCTGGQFCGATECAQGGASAPSSALCVDCYDTTLESICATSRVVVILDSKKNGHDGNRVSGRAVGKALETRCPTSPQVVEAEQDSGDALNPTTGRPVSGGGELLVVAGGPFFQNVEGYLEEQGIAPLYWSVNDDVTEFRKSADDSVVLTRAIAGNHEAQDDFIIQFSRDAESGSLILNVQGFWPSGTLAAGYVLSEIVMGQLQTFDGSWYAYTWIDGDGDFSPDANEITLIDSGG
jgi:hypothetical protein